MIKSFTYNEYYVKILEDGFVSILNLRDDRPSILNLAPAGKVDLIVNYSAPKYLKSDKLKDYMSILEQAYIDMQALELYLSFLLESRE